MKQLFTTLNNGITMPLLGLGVYDMYNREAEEAVTHALEMGYRLIDTASMYKNETEIGNAIRASNIQRNEIFLDLYLVHWPIKKTRKDTWLALEKLYADKRVRAIGVANYLIPFLDELETYSNITPVVDQVEFSPYLFLEDLLNECKRKNIQLQAYTPLVRGQRFADPKLVAVANHYGKTPAQIILRWILQLGVSAIPKSSNLKRLKENFDVFDFHISDTDMKKISAFNENFRVVDDPMGLL
jgi:methylglyoxal/glyoxal reductase